MYTHPSHSGSTLHPCIPVTVGEQCAPCGDRAPFSESTNLVDTVSTTLECLNQIVARCWSVNFLGQLAHSLQAGALLGVLTSQLSPLPFILPSLLQICTVFVTQLSFILVRNQVLPH